MNEGFESTEGFSGFGREFGFSSGKLNDVFQVGVEFVSSWDSLEFHVRSLFALDYRRHHVALLSPCP
jgi:hypothetical protein